MASCGKKWTRISMGPYTNSKGGDISNVKKLENEGIRCVQELVDILGAVGKLRDTESYSEILLQQVRWHKICISAAMNPSAALCGGLDSSDMAANSELHEHLKGVMEEISRAERHLLCWAEIFQRTWLGLMLY